MDQKKPQKVVITTSGGDPFKIPVEGSLGLLALGYKGLVAWRQTRRLHHKSKATNKQQNAESKVPENELPENL